MDIYNLIGSKIATIYQGHIKAGSTVVNYMVPPAQRVSLVYKLSIGEYQTSGKLMNLK